MITVLLFALVMTIVYFVVPVAVPTLDITLMQSAAITLLAFTARLVLTEDINVKVDEMKMVMHTEGDED